MEKFKNGDRLLWTSSFSDRSNKCTFLKYVGDFEEIIANNWDDEPDDPQKEDRCNAVNFRRLTPLEELL